MSDIVVLRGHTQHNMCGAGQSVNTCTCSKILKPLNGPLYDSCLCEPVQETDSLHGSIPLKIALKQYTLRSSSLPIHEATNSVDAILTWISALRGRVWVMRGWVWGLSEPGGLTHFIFSDWLCCMPVMGVSLKLIGYLLVPLKERRFSENTANSPFLL